MQPELAPVEPASRRRPRLGVLGVAGLAVLALVVVGALLARTTTGDEARDGRTRDAVRLSAGAARVAHELQRERDSTAFYLATGRGRNYGNVIAQRVVVNQGVAALEREVERLGDGGLRDHPAMAARLGTAREALGGLRDFRDTQVDVEGGTLTTVAALRWYDGTVAALLDVTAAAADEASEDSVREAIQDHLAVARFKEALARERAYLYGAYGGGGFAAADERGGRRVPFDAFSAVVAERDRLRAEAEQVAPERWRELLGSALTSADAARSAGMTAAVLADPGSVARAPSADARTWLFGMNSTVDAVRGVELPMLDDAVVRAEAAGFRLW